MARPLPEHDMSTTVKSIDPNSKSQRHMTKEEDKTGFERYKALLVLPH